MDMETEAREARRQDDSEADSVFHEAEKAGTGDPCTRKPAERVVWG
jgi:hypothetical protein